MRILSIIVNLAVALFVAGAVFAHTRTSPLGVVMRYYTALSNVFCALACMAVAACRLAGVLPQFVLLLKYIGTSAVTVTFLTVLVFLGPTVGYKPLFSGPDLWLHLICPVLAIVSYLAWDQVSGGFGIVFLGMLPVAAYGLVYLNRVVLMPEELRWEDFYGFNRGGRWPVSFTAMIIGSFLVSLVLWLV